VVVIVLSLLLFGFMFFLVALQFVKQGIEELKATLPETTVAFEPLSGFGQWLGLESAWSSLGVATARVKQLNPISAAAAPNRMPSKWTMPSRSPIRERVG